MRKIGFQISRYSSSVATLLLSIFVLYIINISLFTHSHIVDGVTIVHSHFASQEHKDSASSQDHTQSELTLISVLSQFIAERQLGVELPNIIITEHHSIFVDREVIISTVESCTLPPLRAPPTEIYLG